MPKLKDFSPANKKFTRIEYTPWDYSPAEQTNNLEEEPAPKQVQNRFKTGLEPIQTGLDRGSKQVQNIVDSGSIDVSIGHDPGSKTSLNQVQKKILKPNVTNVSADDIYGLTGAQKKVIFIIIELCCAKGVLTTPPINNTALANKLGIPKETVKTAIRRLIEKNIIVKSKSKQGIGGFCCFEISEEIKYFVLEVQKSSVNTGILDGFNLGSEAGSSTNVVSSSYINTTTNIPTEFSSIDCSPLTHIAFNNSHIIQIYREYERKPQIALAASIIQDSINALAFDLKHNKVADDFKYSPTVVLTALLKKGVPYSSKTPEKFKTPQQEAMEAYWHAKEQQKNAELEAEEKIKQLEFQEWQTNLSEEELLELCPKSEIAEGVPPKLVKTMRRKKALELSKHYFEAEIWPKIKNEIINLG